MITYEPKLVLLGDPEQPSLQELPPGTSEVTGSQLTRFQAEITVRGSEANDTLVAELKSGLNRAVVHDTRGQGWKVISHSYSNKQGTDVFLHWVELEEEESLQLSEVRLPGISLPVDEFKISDMGRPTVQILTRLNSAQHHEFEALIESKREASLEDAYFQAEFAGLWPDKKTVRFGRCLWEDPGDDGSVRHAIVFVPQDGDSQRSASGPFQPTISRLKGKTVELEAKLDALLHALENKGAVDADAARAIMNAGENPPTSSYRYFDRASDIESFYRE